VPSYGGTRLALMPGDTLKIRFVAWACRSLTATSCGTRTILGQSLLQSDLTHGFAVAPAVVPD
jgi:hypothetical protein